MHAIIKFIYKKKWMILLLKSRYSQKLKQETSDLGKLFKKKKNHKVSKFPENKVGSSCRFFFLFKIFLIFGQTWSKVIVPLKGQKKIKSFF